MQPLRPYLFNAYYHWILDNNHTPYLLVNAEYPHVDVPKEFIRDGKIVLNISPRSIGQYVVSNDTISFNARFQGMLRDVFVPFGALEAIYSQETGDGIMFQEEEHYSPDAYLARSERNDKPVKERKKVSHLKLVK